MSPKNYLKRQYPAATAASYYREWQDFASYLEQLNIPIKEVGYPLILDYVKKLQIRGLKAVSINRKLVVLEAVLEGLGLHQDNPTRSFRVKTGTRPAVQEPIKLELLEELLQSYPTKNIYQCRNKVLLSLIHHQALKKRELQALQVAHVNLEKAILQVPSVGRSNPRALLLKAQQIKLLEHYIQTIRPQLLHHPTDQLFLTGGRATSLQNSFQKLQKWLQKRLPQLQHLAHWRSSIIVHWLGNQPLLVVQEKVGHRYASSTERYQLQAVQSLQESLKKHHPLADLEDA